MSRPQPFDDGPPSLRFTYAPADTLARQLADELIAMRDALTVRYPDIDMSSQMTQLIMAQRGYQANAAVVDRAKETYMAALQIGRS